MAPCTPNNTKTSTKETAQVQVALRVRPLTSQDRAQPRFSQSTESDVVQIHNDSLTVVPHHKSFSFDHVFGTDSTQEQVFSTVASNMVDRFVDGYNVTILAYGQTSSGKTYTMGTEIGHDQRNPEHEGIIPRAMTALFHKLGHGKNKRPNSTIVPAPSTTTQSGLPRRPMQISPSNNSTSPPPTRLRPMSMTVNRRISTSSLNDQHRDHAQLHDKTSKCTVKVSFVEIYNEELVDLLNPAPASERPPVTVREDPKGQIYWTGVKEVPVESTDDVLRYLQMGTLNRATGSTDMNAKSSRSHAIFSVTLKQEKWVPATTSSKTTTNNTSSSGIRQPQSTRSTMIGRRSSTMNVRAMVGQMEKQQHDDDNGKWVVSHSKFHFVDLAGSERLKRTAAQGDRRKEGININAGLLALGNVISALADSHHCSSSPSSLKQRPTPHIPYRDSKLTRLLQDSLGGNATTLMIACISPAEVNLVETVNTLKYAHRARNIKNRVERNETEEWLTNDNPEYLRGLINKLKAEVRHLKTQAAANNQALPPSPQSLPTPSVSLDNVSATTTTTSTEDNVNVAELRRQIVDLQKQVAIARERNQHVEKELQRKQDLDFQHLVEPVIAEYEKSVSALESQLAMARAALSHSDQALADQEAKLAQYASLHENEQETLSELKARLAKSTEREQTNESYIAELEGKLARTVDEAVEDQQMLTDLRQKLVKFKEMDESTEQYINDIETRLAHSEQERDRLLQLCKDAQTKLSEQQSQLDTIRKRLSTTGKDEDQQALLIEDLARSETRCRELEGELLRLRDTLHTREEQVVQDQHLLQVAEEQSTLPQEKSLKDELAVEEATMEIRDQLAQKTAQIEMLEKKLRESSGSVESLKEETQQKMIKVEELSKQLTEMQVAHTEWIKVREQQQLEMTRLETCLKEARVAMEMTQQELQTLQTTHASELHDAQATAHQALTDQEQRFHAMLQQRMDEAEQARQDAQVLLQVQERQQDVIATLEEKMRAMDELVQSLRQQLADRDRQIDELERINNDKTQMVKDLQDRVQQVLYEVRTVGLERNQLDVVIQFLEAALRQQDRKADKAMLAIQDLQMHCTSRTDQVHGKSDSIDQLEQEKKSLERALVDMTRRVKKHEALIATFQQQLRLSQEALTEQDEAMDKIKVEIEEANRIRSRMDQVEKALDKTRSERDTLNNELASFKKQLENAEKALTEETHKSTRLQNSITALEHTMDIERSLIAANDTTGMMSMLQDKCKALEKAKDELMQQLQHANTTLDETRRDKDNTVASLESLLQTTQARLDEAVASHAQQCKQIEALQHHQQQQLTTNVRRRRLSNESQDSGLPDERHLSSLAKRDRDHRVGRSSHSGSSEDLSANASRQHARMSTHDPTLESLHKLQTRFREKLTSSEGREELLDKLLQLMTENSQLSIQVNDLEGQLVTQRSQSALENKSLELEVMKLSAANERLEREMEQAMPRSHSNTSIASTRSPRNSILLMNASSPPQTPRVGSPKLFARQSCTLGKSASFRIVRDIEPSLSTPAASKRASATSIRPTMARPRVRAQSTVLPPPSAPPNNPLPPVPTRTRSSLIINPTDPISPSPSFSTPTGLQRQDSVASSTISEMLNSDGNFTTEQYEKIIRSLQRRAFAADQDIRAHQDVISKLEFQLTGAEDAVRNVRRQLDTAHREKQTYMLEIETLRSSSLPAHNDIQQSHSADSQVKRLQEELAAERALKDKAEKARVILENRMDQLMTKRNKFMCF